MPDSNITTELNKVLRGMTAPSAVSPVASVPVQAAAPAADAQSNALAEAIAANTAQLTDVRAAIQTQLDSVAENTRALIENTTSKSSGVASAVGDVGKSILGNVLGGGLLAPIVSGLMHLFGGGDDNTAPPPLVKFALPPAVNFNAGVQGGSVGEASYGQNDHPRLSAPAASTVPAQQITVNVSAMDSQSFLDRSADIANAVRRAMLESSSLNDVIGEM
jgi:hypothetical protein